MQTMENLSICVGQRYILTADDDIDYPHDYVERMVHEVRPTKTVWLVYGAALPYGPPFTRWSQYANMRRSVFALEHGGRIPVDVIGTGTMAFHSEVGIPDIEAMDTLRMVDLHVAHWAAKKGVNMHMVPRKRDWLVEFDGLDEQRIWQQTKADKELQHMMLRVLGRNPKWSRSAVGNLRLRQGPLASLASWSNREVPPAMELSSLEPWSSLPEYPLVTIYILLTTSLNTSNRRWILRSLKPIATSRFACTMTVLQMIPFVIKTTVQEESKSAHWEGPNRGISAASNQAILAGTGEVILQLDGDDTIEPDAVEILLKSLRTGHVCACGNFRRIDPREHHRRRVGEPVFTRERLLRSMIASPTPLPS